MSSNSLSAFLKHRMIVNCNLFQTYCATSSSFCSSSFCLLNTCSIISRSSALKCERSGIASAIMALIHPLHREATKQRQSNLKFIGMNPEARKLTLENHRQPRSKNELVYEFCCFRIKNQVPGENEGARQTAISH